MTQATVRRVSAAETARRVMQRKNIRESGAWFIVAQFLEGRDSDLAYDVPQPSLCQCIQSLLQMGNISRHTWCKMRVRVQLFAPYNDTSSGALYWNRCYKAARKQRILAAWFLYHMSREEYIP